jgi:site-specific DNA recombinase
MPSTNGHGSRRAILYSRVSTDEQASSGYSLAQQLEALREYAAREGYEVLEEVQDPGQSGASLERPGMDRIRDLVAAGGVSVVLAQDRDRFAREPAYHYLLRREFEEHGAKIRALNDRGDGSPEGELTDGILDQIAKFERAKIAERTRRGRLRRAREGKIMPGRMPNYGFRYNAARDGYEVDERTMPVVRRIFDLIVEGASVNGAKKRLEAQGVPNPQGGKSWCKRTFRLIVHDDVYLSRGFEEIQKLVTPEVAAKLNPEDSYGVWWFNRRRVVTNQTAEAGENGRRYRKHVKIETRPKEEWIAVPVVDAGIPREVAEMARQAIKDRLPTPASATRFWELSRGILHCGCFGARMNAERDRPRPDGPFYNYYRCNKRHQEGKHACPEGRKARAEPLEERVWALVSDVLLNPQQLESGLKRMVEEERSVLRGNPEDEAKTWAKRLAEVDRKRSGFQDLAAEGLITLEELRAKLNALEEARKVARTELDALASRSERVAASERDAEAVVRDYAGLMPEALGAMAPEERHRVYKMLRLKVLVHPDGSGELSGVFGNGPLVGPTGITPNSLSRGIRCPELRSCRPRVRRAVKIFLSSM